MERRGKASKSSQLHLKLYGIPFGADPGFDADGQQDKQGRGGE